MFLIIIALISGNICYNKNIFLENFCILLNTENDSYCMNLITKKRNDFVVKFIMHATEWKQLFAYHFRKIFGLISTQSVYKIQSLHNNKMHQTQKALTEKLNRWNLAFVSRRKENTPEKVASCKTIFVHSFTKWNHFSFSIRIQIVQLLLMYIPKLLKIQWHFMGNLIEQVRKKYFHLGKI